MFLGVNHGIAINRLLDPPPRHASALGPGWGLGGGG